MTTYIRSDQCLDPWPANQQMRIVVPVTPAAGRTLANSWASFVLTVREDPLWPREGKDLSAQPDPVGEAWATTLSVVGTPSGATALTFPLTAPVSPGTRRYVLDVRGVGGDAGEVAFVRPTWLTVLPSVR